MLVQFVGNQMYHQDKYLGFGISGKPMLSLRYMAEWFGFQVDYDPESRTILVSTGEYGFRIKPGSKVAAIYWGGEKVKDYELMETPL
ncbi:MAG: copper amine oxidase N-terminal domain-containing protein, partial [Clostridia bacterium]|nr:copper amine oxidase N-terminal domain-containing protein [Clostridia bacterium]